MKITFSLSLITRVTALLCVVLLLGLRLSAQDKAEEVVPSSSELEAVRLELAHQAEQSPDEFKRLRDEIFRQSKDHPSDLLSQFKWGVFVNESAKNGTLDKGFELMDVSNALGIVKEPWPLEYQRIFFIISSMAFPSEEDVPVGRDLSKNYPEDSEVLYHFGRSLNRIRSRAEGAEQFAVAQKVLKLAPEKLSSHYLMSIHWYGMWRMEKKGSKERREFGQKFIDSAETYIKLAPKGNENAEFLNQERDRVVKDIK